MSDDLAILGFSAEASETAATHFRLLRRYCVSVVTTDLREFDAEVIDVDAHNKLELAPWDEETGEGDRSRTELLDIYDDLDKVVVI